MERRLAARVPLVLLHNRSHRQWKNYPVASQHRLGQPSAIFSNGSDTADVLPRRPMAKVDRIWTIRTDGSQNQLMHQRTMPGEIAGHEFWGKDGETLWYDLQTPKGEDFWLASVNMKTKARTWYHLQRDEWSIHFNVNKGATLFTGDGGDPRQVAKSERWRVDLSFPSRDLENEWPYQQRLAATWCLPLRTALVNMSKHNYTLEPNVSFTPDGKMIIFRSNMFGPTYVFGVDVEKAI